MFIYLNIYILIMLITKEKRERTKKKGKEVIKINRN